MNDGEDLPLHHSQAEVKTEEEYSVFTYYIAPTYDFIQEILSHGYEIEVRSPSHPGDISVGRRRRWLRTTDEHQAAHGSL